MKRTIILILIILGMSACSSPSGEPTQPPAEEGNPLPTATPLDPEQEWGIVIKGTGVLDAACGMLFKTYTDYDSGGIKLERAQQELDAEAGFVESVQEELATLINPSEAAAGYLVRLEEQLPALVNMLGNGEGSLNADNTALESLHQVCLALDGIWEDLPEKGQAVGLSEESLLQIYREANQSTTEVYENTEWGRTEADVPEASSGQVSSTPGEGAAELGEDQEQLMELWRPAYNLGALLYETCTMTYNTHADYGQGVIGLERAQVELDAESNFVEYVMRGITSTIPGSEQVASHLLEIETQANALVEWLVPASLELSGGLDAIEHTCLALQNRMDQIYNQIQEAGISGDALDELDDEVTPIIQDLYDQTWYGR